MKLTEEIEKRIRESVSTISDDLAAEFEDHRLVEISRIKIITVKPDSDELDLGIFEDSDDDVRVSFGEIAEFAFCEETVEENEEVLEQWRKLMGMIENQYKKHLAIQQTP